MFFHPSHLILELAGQETESFDFFPYSVGVSPFSIFFLFGVSFTNRISSSCSFLCG